MDAEFSTDLQQAFVAKSEDLRNLAKLLSERIGEITLNADCADGVTRKFSTIAELLAFDNAKSKEIVRLRMMARSDDFKKRGEIDLSGSKWRGISIRLEAREDVVGRLKESVLDIVASMRPMYSWLHRYDFIWILFAIQLILGFLPALLVALGIYDGSGSASISARTAARATILGLILPVFSIGLGTLANRFRNALFPKAFFAIGQSEKRLQKLEKIQGIVIMGFLVSFAASVVVAILQALMA